MYYWANKLSYTHPHTSTKFMSNTKALLDKVQHSSLSHLQTNVCFMVITRGRLLAALHCVCHGAVTQLLCHLRLLEDTFRPDVAGVWNQDRLRVSAQAEISQEAVYFLRHPCRLPAPASLKPVIAQATSNCVQALLAPSRAAVPPILLSKRVSPL